MNSDKERQREYDDRVLDRALTEIVGGDTPPDLTERILKQLPIEATFKKVTNMEPRKKIKVGLWPFVAIAASLLLVSMVLFPSIQPAREAARRPNNAPYIEPTPPRRKSISAGTQWSYSSDALAVKPKSDAVKMMVTPRIIIQQEEEERLGVGPTNKPKGEGRGPGAGGDQYARIHENPFLAVADNPLSTFSIDVDTAAYANMRQYITNVQQLPPPDSVRIEELINYFHYDYAPPTDGETPFAAHMEVTGCPWAPKHRLLRVGLKGREIPDEERPASNLVFLIDVSGSMAQPNKLPLVIRGLKTLSEQLGENDRVAIVVYASAEGLVLDSTPGARRQEILAVLDELRAGGSTNGGAGIELAYQIATDHLIPGGTNRVILCTDGDFNVGTTSSAALERIVEDKAKTGVFLTVLGFGRGNLNDQMMETISGRGNGNYFYVDSDREAQKILVEEMGGTLVTIAKDVKIQIEFNPAVVGGYRLIGYENRILAKEDFNDDTKDAGEIGAGHTVTALYELIPAGESMPRSVDLLKYQSPPQTKTNADAAEAETTPDSNEMLTLKLRYKEPEAEASKRLEFPLSDEGKGFGAASRDTKFAAAVAMFGMLLRESEHKGNATYDAAIEIAEDGAANIDAPEEAAYRAEFIELVRQAKAIAGD